MSERLVWSRPVAGLYHGEGGDYQYTVAKGQSELLGQGNVSAWHISRHGPNGLGYMGQWDTACGGRRIAQEDYERRGNE